MNDLAQLKLGIAGLDSPGLTRKVHRALGLGTGLADPAARLRLGDQAANLRGGQGFYFLDFAYLVSPYAVPPAKGYRRRPTGELAWRKDFAALFAPSRRRLPLLLDSGGYRRCISRTAAAWTHESEWYWQAIDLIQPEGFAGFDDPTSRTETLSAMKTMMTLFPADIDNGRLWPVFSARWSWDPHLRGFNSLPPWVPNGSLTTLVPLNATQRVYRPETIEYWAALAIGNALQVAADPDFRALLERFNGRMMIGGLVAGPCHRLTRHLYVATLCHLFPAATFWLLGQASYPVLNGLGLLGLLDRVVTDGTAYLQDASNERISYVEEGLITIQNLEQTKAQKAERRPRREFFFTFEELMAGALRSMLAAYAGLIAWPQLPEPIDLRDFEQLVRLKQGYRGVEAI